MHPFTDQFAQSNPDFLQENMMGPNAMRISEEMASFLDIQAGMRVLDLGCGRGLSTLFLVQKYGVTAFAADLWIPPAENHERFRAFGIDDKAIPVSVDATKGLPFANGYFDLLFSVDSYHYFGGAPEMLPSLTAFVKKGGYIAIAIPGLKHEFGASVPAEMQPFWGGEMAKTIRGFAWWQSLWRGTKGIEIVDCREMACCKQAWDEWLASSSPYAAEDVKMMEAEGGKYFNLIQLIARVV